MTLSSEESGRFTTSAPFRQGRRFPHYGKDIETVHREEATHLDTASSSERFSRTELIGFIKLVDGRYPKRRQA